MVAVARRDFHVSTISKQTKRTDKYGEARSLIVCCKDNDQAAKCADSEDQKRNGVE
jgi:hypothetical protein